MLTKNGICLKIRESEYKSLKYGLVFYFSSKLYLDKFNNNVNRYVDEETLKLQNKYKITCNFEVYLAISYYKKIEHRGFYVIDEVSNYEIKDNSKFLSVLIK